MHRDLTFELGPVDDEGRRDFVVSAGGIQAAFPVARALVAAAPPLPRWRMIALRPRREPASHLTLGDVTVTADQVYVAATPDGEKLGLTLFIDGYRPTPDKVYEQIAFLLLDNALGEYDVETRIGFIDVADAARAPATGLLSLSELPALVDRVPIS